MIIDNHSASSEEETRKEAINIQTWLRRKDLVSSFKCHQILRNGLLAERYYTPYFEEETFYCIAIVLLRLFLGYQEGRVSSASLVCIFIVYFAFASDSLKLARDCDQKFASFALQISTCPMKLNLCRRQKTGSSKQFSYSEHLIVLCNQL